MSGMEKFSEVYLEQLTIAVRDHPREYKFPLDQVPEIAMKMLAMVAAGKGYGKEGRAMKATCKKLGIKQTYMGINEFIVRETV